MFFLSTCRAGVTPRSQIHDADICRRFAQSLRVKIENPVLINQIIFPQKISGEGYSLYSFAFPCQIFLRRFAKLSHIQL